MSAAQGAGRWGGAGASRLRSAKRDVVVLPRPVDAREGLLVHQAREAVASRNFLGNLHEHKVLVDLRGRSAEKGRVLILVGRDLAVPGAHGDPHHEALVLNLLDAGHRDLVGRAHVVITHLLATRRVLPHDCAAGELEVHPLVEGRSRHEEVLLLQTDVWLHAADRIAEELEQPRGLDVHRLHRAKQRRLLVERVAVEGDEDRRDEDRVSAQEDRRGGVYDGVAAGGVRGAHAAVGVRGAVSLSLEQLLPLELVLHLAVRAEGEHGILHLARQPVAEATRTERLEPVRVDGGALVVRPVHHGGGHLVRRGGRPLGIVKGACGEALLAQVLVGHCARELVRAEVLGGGDKVAAGHSGGGHAREGRAPRGGREALGRRDEHGRRDKHDQGRTSTN